MEILHLFCQKLTTEQQIIFMYFFSYLQFTWHGMNDCAEYYNNINLY